MAEPPDENSCKNVDSTLRQTSEEVTHEDNHDVRPRTPIHKARIYKDGNPSSMQTQENPDPQFLETMLPMKNEHERTLCSPSADNEAFGQGSFKLSAKECEKLRKKVTELKRGKRYVKKCEKLKKTVGELKHENERLEEDVKKIEDEKAILEDKNAKLEDKNANLEDKNAKLEKEYKKLKIYKACLDKEKPCGVCQKCLATSKSEWPLCKKNI